MLARHLFYFFFFFFFVGFTFSGSSFERWALRLALKDMATIKKISKLLQHSILLGQNKLDATLILWWLFIPKSFWKKLKQRSFLLLFLLLALYLQLYLWCGDKFIPWSTPYIEFFFLPWLALKFLAVSFLIFPLYLLLFQQIHFLTPRSTAAYSCRLPLL